MASNAKATKDCCAGLMLARINKSVRKAIDYFDQVVDPISGALSAESPNKIRIQKCKPLLDPGLDGGVTNDPDLTSALLNGYHQVWRGTDNYFRSKCSKKAWRPRKRRSGEEEPTDDETAAWDPAGWTGTPNVDAQEFFPSYIPPPPRDLPPLPLAHYDYDDAAYAAQNCLPPAYYYDDAAYDAWQNAAYAFVMFLLVW